MVQEYSYLYATDSFCDTDLRIINPTGRIYVIGIICLVETMTKKTVFFLSAIS
jgi:hypothetical protein